MRGLPVGAGRAAAAHGRRRRPAVAARRRGAVAGAAGADSRGGGGPTGVGAPCCDGASRGRPRRPRCWRWRRSASGARRPVVLRSGRPCAGCVAPVALPSPGSTGHRRPRRRIGPQAAASRRGVGPGGRPARRRSPAGRPRRAPSRRPRGLTARRVRLATPSPRCSCRRRTGGAAALRGARPSRAARRARRSPQPASPRPTSPSPQPSTSGRSRSSRSTRPRAQGRRRRRDAMTTSHCRRRRRRSARRAPVAASRRRRRPRPRRQTPKPETPKPERAAAPERGPTAMLRVPARDQPLPGREEAGSLPYTLPGRRRRRRPTGAHADGRGHAGSRRPPRPERRAKQTTSGVQYRNVGTNIDCAAWDTRGRPLPAQPRRRELLGAGARGPGGVNPGGPWMPRPAFPLFRRFDATSASLCCATARACRRSPRPTPSPARS